MIPVNLIVTAFALSVASPQQQQIPVRDVAKPEAVSKDTVGFLYGVRELSDGRLIANDSRSRRLMLFDKSLSAFTLIADSATGSQSPYGRQATGIIPYRGDSTLLIDLAARAFLVVDPAGEIVRVMSPPKPSDVSFMWNPAMGTPAFDTRGRLIYRSWFLPNIKAPEPGKPYVTPEMPDSAPILRGDFDTRTVDTLAWVRIPKMKVTATPIAGGGMQFRPMITPVASIDDWTVLADGSLAIVRGLDYHIDWIDADATRHSSPKMPFDWKRMSDSEKVAIVDSTKAALARAALTGGDVSAIPGMAASPHGGGGGAQSGHSLTVMPVTPGDGGPAPKPAPSVTTTPSVPDVVSPQDLPDYVPPVLRSGTMRTDPHGNVWVLPSTSAQSSGGIVYDVINRKGEVFERVRLPAGRALEGFGAGGVLYLTSHDATGAHIERARIK